MPSVALHPMQQTHRQDAMSRKSTKILERFFTSEHYKVQVRAARNKICSLPSPGIAKASMVGEISARRGNCAGLTRTRRAKPLRRSWSAKTLLNIFLERGLPLHAKKPEIKHRYALS